MVPTNRLFLLVAVGLVLAAAPLVVRIELWIGVAAMWAGLTIALLVDVLGIRSARLRVLAEPPTSVGVGETLEVPLRVDAGGTLALPLRVRAEVSKPLELLQDGHALARPGSSDAELAVRAAARGVGRFEAVWSELTGPLGLLAQIDRTPCETPEVRVVPSTRRMRELVIAHSGSRGESGQVLRRVAGEGGEFDAMVSYSFGMDPRAIDWKSSARHQDLRVRRYRLATNQRLVLCIDTGRLMGDTIDGLSRLDHGIHAALVLAQTALRGQDLVGLHAYGSEPTAWVPPATGIRHASRLAEVGATLKANADETNHVLGIHTLLTRLRRRSLVVVFTEFSDSTTAELMLETLGHVARKHVIVFVALDDPQVEAPLSLAPTTPRKMAAAVVAGHLKEDRRRVLNRLSRLGVEVISGPPTVATLQLLSRYLHIKRRGRIG